MSLFLNHVCAGRRLVSTCFLEIDLVCKVCLCVCPPPRLVTASDVMWHDMNPYDWLNKFYSFYMAAIVGIISIRGFRIEACCRNQPNKTELTLYKPLLYFYSHLEQLYINNKIKVLHLERWV